MRRADRRARRRKWRTVGDELDPRGELVERTASRSAKVPGREFLAAKHPGKPATFEEFRESLETLLQRSREFARHSDELIQRMTALPAPEVRRAGFGIGDALLLTAALIVGGLLGKFVF